MEKITKQIEFILEIDKLKQVFRRNYLSDGSRTENDAEHSWFFAMAAMILQEHAAEPVDITKVMEMALIHDIVEIDAGDTLVYDEEGKKDQAEREEAAAQRIFNILPTDQADYYYKLWKEFESFETPESKYAKAIDRFSAMVLNYASRGKAWQEHGITADRIFNMNSKIAEGSPALWDAVKALLEEIVEKGYIS